MEFKFWWKTYVKSWSIGYWSWSCVGKGVLTERVWGDLLYIMVREGFFEEGNCKLRSEGWKVVYCVLGVIWKKEGIGLRREFSMFLREEEMFLFCIIKNK